MESSKMPYFKNNQFRKEIRRKQINFLMKEKRQSLLRACFTIEEMADKLGMPSIQQPYTMQQMLMHNEKYLIEPSFLKGAIEEQTTSQQNTQYKVDTQINIDFWHLYSEVLNDGKEIYCAALGDFLMRLIQLYSYRTIHASTTYELHILNTLEVICPELEFQKRKRVMLWVEGAQGLRVIKSCLLERQFLNPYIYKNVYQVIIQGLMYENLRQVKLAGKVLLMILRDATWDDTFKLYNLFPDIMIRIVEKIICFADVEQIRDLWLAAICLLDTFTEGQKHYARTGTSYAAAKLIKSKFMENVIGGIQLLRIISEIDNPKTIRQLIQDVDLHGINFWDFFCQENFFFKHQQKNIRRTYYSIICNILANGHHEEIVTFCELFSEQWDILNLMEFALTNQINESSIIILIIRSLKTLVYYGQQMKQNCQENGVVAAIQRRGMLKRLLQLNSSLNIQVNEESVELVGMIQTVRKHESNLQIEQPI